VTSVFNEHNHSFRPKHKIFRVPGRGMIGRGFRCALRSPTRSSRALASSLRHVSKLLLRNAVNCDCKTTFCRRTTRRAESERLTKFSVRPSVFVKLWRTLRATRDFISVLTNTMFLCDEWTSANEPSENKPVLARHTGAVSIECFETVRFCARFR
jgi:hypothetical protein